MASSRADNIIADLRQDPFARSVLDRVEAGPYGQNSRSRQDQNVSQEGFYDAIMGSELGSTYEDRRSRRQSRVTREIVSVQDGSSAVPTMEWQNQLSRRLAHTSEFSSPSTNTSLSSPAGASYVAAGSSTPSSNGGEPPRRRVRTNGIFSSDSTAGGPHDMYTLGDSYYDDFKTTVDALGHLSVNENEDIRFHDKSAGLHLLAQSARNDDSKTKENGIWKFPPSKEDAISPGSRAEVQVSVQWPSPAVQDHLLSVYFTYVHPFYPIIHKYSFLALYNARKLSPKSRQRKSIQSISDLLLLSMFAFAAPYSDDEMKRNPSTRALHEQVSKGGKSYAADARKVLNTVYQHSRPSTCQALLLMGIREYGIGSMEQGWLFVGMGCRMAVDLGMNHNADQWKNARGENLFSATDMRARRLIWASCCLADKLSSVWLGRPVMFRESDYNVDFPEVVEAEELEEWRSYPQDALSGNFAPAPGRIMSCFREQCKLSLIMCNIMTKIYPINASTDDSRRGELEVLEARLHHWLFELPDHLRYCETSRRLTPLPHILALHIEYQFAVLLLHRAFIPNWNDGSPASSSHVLDHDPLPLKSFDICQGAASHISSMITAFSDHYGLNRCPPLFNVFLQGAGIMHIVTLMRRPGNTQGTIGLMRCIEAAKKMKATWPWAASVKTLLQGVRVQMDDLAAWASTSPSDTSRPGKRGATDAVGFEQHTEAVPRDVFNMIAPPIQPSLVQAGPNAQLLPVHSQAPDESDRLFERQLGLPVSAAAQGSTPFYSGFEWWPQSMISMHQYDNPADGLRFFPSGNAQDGLISDYSATQEPFTLNGGHLSSTFPGSVARDDAAPRPSHYHHNG